jgi:ribosome-associated protein
MTAKTTDIPVSGEMIRLDDFLKMSGAMESGGQAKVEIQRGMVWVEGAVCTRRRQQLPVGSVVRCRGQDYRVTRCAEADV